MGRFDHYGLAEARHQAGFSKDPGTKVGAAILRPDGTLASVGRNGFAKGIYDAAERLADRQTKLALTLHAEENAILLARERVAGYTIYVWPFHPCAHCASVIVQSDLLRVVAPAVEIPDRWAESFSLARDVLDEAGVVLDLITMPAP